MATGGILTISTLIMNGSLQIQVSDTGIGIPDEFKPQLFTPFATTKEKGLGLGLAYCKRAVEAHGGSIKVDSKESEGTTFTINLPINQ